MSLLRRPFEGVPEFDRLKMIKQLGCGHEGCVYSTENGTVVKVAEVHPRKVTRWGQLMAEAELDAAHVLMRLGDKYTNTVIPRIVRVGRVMVPSGAEMIFIEREGLNDVLLSDEGETQFTSDDVGRILGGASNKLVPVIPDYVPPEDRKKLKAIVRGYLWLKSHGVEPEDHNSSENWGERADGSVALRDLGHVRVTS